MSKKLNHNNNKSRTPNNIQHSQKQPSINIIQKEQRTGTVKQTTPIPTLKVVLLGDLGVGKTCLRSQFVHHIFSNAYKATIGGDYLTTTILLPNQDTSASSSSTTITTQQDSSHENLLKTTQRSTTNKSTTTKINLQIWDTAGQERFNSISQAFYRGTDVCVLVYDITNYESVLSIRDWFSRFIQHCHVDFPGVVIVGNKMDKINERCVDLEEIKDIVTSNTTVANVGDYIEDWDLALLEVSAKRLDLVEKLFSTVGKIGMELILGERSKKLHDFSIDLRETHQHLEESRSGGCAC